MTQVVRRPAAMFRPGDGLLRNDHFQIAYVTNDIKRACAIFSDRYGIKDYHHVEGPMPSGGYIRVALAWVGGANYEIIQAEGPGTEFYTGRLQPDTFSIRHHHLGYLVGDQAGWKALGQEIARGGWKIVFDVKTEGFMHAIYIEAPELGHYLEYILPERAGIEFFEATIPRS